MNATCLTRRALGRWALLALALPGAAHATPTGNRADALAPMVALDALYIPALSLTNAAAADARQSPRARAATTRLQAAWPDLRRELKAHPPDPARANGWARALGQVHDQIERAGQSVQRGDWKQAHEDFEPVRTALMQQRVAAGFDYFIDRLTAFHEPMETLALAGATTAPDDLGPARRQALEQAFVQAAAAWRAVERGLPDLRAYRLSPAREAQFRQGMAAEGVALSRLSDALRAPGQAAAVLVAARALKPPFARTFTAFGLAEGEALPA